MIKAIKREKPESILILGTSDGMVEKIANNLNIGPILETVYIQDVATEDACRVEHYISPETFEALKNYFDPLIDKK